MTSQTQATTQTDTGESARRERRVEGVLPERTVGGIVLIAIGIVIVASRLIPGAGQYALLAVGVTCLIAFMLTREYAYAAAAGITSGLGAGIALSGLATDPYDGVVFMFSFAVGFLAVWILGLFADPRETSPWPLIPAAVFAAIGVTIITESSTVIDWLIAVVAVILIAAGIRAFLGSRKAATS